MEIKLTATDPKFKVGDVVFNHQTHRRFTVTKIEVDLHFYINAEWLPRIAYSYWGTDVLGEWIVDSVPERVLALASEVTYPAATVEIN